MKLFFFALAVAGFVVGAWIPNGIGTPPISALAMTASLQEEDEHPVELGAVNWLRDLDTAVAISKSDDKPIALLFQEVPG